MPLDHTDEQQREAAAKLERRDKAAEAEYRREHGRLERAAQALEERLEQACGRKRVEPLRIYARVKDWDALLPKVQDGRASPWDRCTDLIAARIVVLFQDEVRDVELAVKALTMRDSVQRHVWHASTPKARGHHATHLQLDLSAHDVPEHLCEVGAELQIVTAMQESWVSLSHDDFYKASRGVPGDHYHRLRRLAAVMNLVDDELQELRRSLQPAITARREEIDAAAGNDRLGDVRLDGVSLLACVDFHMYEDFVALKKLAREAGYTVSGWAPLVQRSELDRFLWFAEQANIRRLSDLERALDFAKRSKAGLVRVREVHAARDPDPFRLFDRPLDVLIITETLRWGHRVLPPLDLDLRDDVMEARASLSPDELSNGLR